MAGSGVGMNDEAFVGLLLDELRAGRRVALCAVFDTCGSMPRGAGARMAVFEDGRMVGTIGGGRVEQMGLERCAEVLAGGEAVLEWLTHAQTGMACGGDALVATRVLGPDDRAVLEELATLGDAAGWLVEDWSDAAHPAWTLAPPTSVPRACDVPTWDGESRRYVEPVGGRAHAFVFGAGHVGRALVGLLPGIGYEPVVLDDRPELAEFLRHSDMQVRVGSFAQLAAEADITARDAAIVLTHGHVADVDVLAQVLPKAPAYVGCIGSRKKAAFAREELAARGLSQEQVDAIHMPIGARIGAVTPAEIAVSIAAELIRCRAERRPHNTHQLSVCTGADGQA